MAEIRPLLPPKDGNSRLRVTSVIRNGDPAPTIFFAGTIAPETVTAMVLDRPPYTPRAKVLHDLALYLADELDRFCDAALKPPGGK